MLFFFQKSNKLNPNNPNIIFNLALALQSEWVKLRQAKKEYLKLISINSKNIRGLLWFVYFRY